MVESIFNFLASVGFTHPLHPMFVHLPMGLIIGMVVFALLGIITTNNQLNQAAYYCSVLSFLGIFPVIGSGILDWLHRLDGEWDDLIIIKMALAGVLTLLLAFAIQIKRGGGQPGKILFIYILCLACAGGLGFSGGELVYG